MTIKRSFTTSSLALLAAALAAVLPGTCPAQEYAAILAKGTGLYQETFLSFQKSLGSQVAVFDLSAEDPRLPRELRTAVAFGAKAAAFKYPENTRVIALLAPGYTPPAGGDFTVISCLPDPAEAAAAFRKLQPALGRLAVFFLQPGPAAYLEDLAAAAGRHGFKVIPSPLEGTDDLPGALRALAGRADAFWLLPEPSLINKAALLLMSDFSCANRLPFYAPSAGLCELGATASFAPGPAETAVAAAAVLRRTLSGDIVEKTLYAAHSRITVNESVIRKCGLPVSIPPQ